MREEKTCNGAAPEIVAGVMDETILNADGADPAAAHLAVAVARLAKLDRTAYEARRKEEAALHGIRVRVLDAAVASAQAAARAAENGGGDDNGIEKLGQRERLVATALAEGMTFWPDADGNGFATVPDGTTVQRHRIISTSFRRLLRERYGKRWPVRTPAGLVPGGVADTALSEALSTLEAMAGGAEAKIPAVRCAEYDRGVMIDLGTADWRAIKVEAGKWSILDRTDAPLIRPKGLEALPVPVRHPDSIGTFRGLVNLSSEEDFMLVCAWLVAALHPRGPFCILAIDGEQGSAKTTTCKMFRRLVDPNKADLRSPPKTGADIVLAASNGRVVAFENVSFIDEELADDLCRVATGAGFGTRQLYSNGEEFLAQVCAPVLVNGIPSLMARGDLADRTLALTTPAIPAEFYRSEDDIAAASDAAAPAIFALLLDGLAEALARLPTFRLPRLPRMGWFTKLACAAAPAFNWTAEAMLAAIEANRAAALTTVIEADPVAEAVRAFLERQIVIGAGPEWKGTATDLHALLGFHVPSHIQREKKWPKDATRLSTALRRAAPALRRVGISVAPDKGGRGKDRHRAFVLHAPEK